MEGQVKSIFGMSDLDAKKNVHLVGDFAFKPKYMFKILICLLFYFYFKIFLCGGYFSIYLFPFPRKRKTLSVENSHRHPSRVEGGVGFLLSRRLFFFGFVFYVPRN